MADKINVGDVEIVAALDMVPPPRDPAAFFSDVPTDRWVPYKADVLKNDQLQLY